MAKASEESAMQQYRLFPDAVAIYVHYKYTFINDSLVVRRQTLPRIAARKNDLVFKRGWDKKVLVVGNLKRSKLPAKFDFKALTKARICDQEEWKQLPFDLSDGCHRRVAMEELELHYGGSDKFPAEWNCLVGVIPHIDMPVDISRNHGMTENDFQARHGTMTIFDWMYSIWETYQLKDVQELREEASSANGFKSKPAGKDAKYNLVEQKFKAGHGDSSSQTVPSATHIGQICKFLEKLDDDQREHLQGLQDFAAYDLWKATHKWADDETKEDKNVQERLEQHCFLLPVHVSSRTFNPLKNKAGLFTADNARARFRLKCAFAHMWARFVRSGGLLRGTHKQWGKTLAISIQQARLTLSATEQEELETALKDQRDDHVFVDGVFANVNHQDKDCPPDHRADYEQCFFLAALRDRKALAKKVTESFVHAFCKHLH